ncbi:hypothetical protein HYV43_05555 [Candidatus Micrarchaeota archaeon]|nr:hypothetical protein [Candidatus Micrarchaeota archaeon]
MVDRVVLASIALGVLLILAGDAFMFWTQARADADLQTVKSEWANSRSSLVVLPVTNWLLVALFSSGSLAIGLGAGLWLGRRFGKRR